MERSVKRYGSRLSVEPLVIYGGASIGAQIEDLRFGCDVIVATPGRLLDHLERGTVDLSSVEVLVLDEADRMLDMGFIDDVKDIVKRTPKSRQTLLFSATVNSVLGLVHEMMRDPVQVQIGFEASAEGITEVIHPVDHAAKYGVLAHLLDEWGDEGQAIVFTRMKVTASQVCEFLQRKGVNADDLHGDKAQRDRERSLEGFRKREIRVLVATNVAARGLDIVGVTHVVNFDVPDDPEGLRAPGRSHGARRRDRGRGHADVDARDPPGQADREADGQEGGAPGRRGLRALVSVCDRAGRAAAGRARRERRALAPGPRVAAAADPAADRVAGRRAASILSPSGPRA